MNEKLSSTKALIAENVMRQNNLLDVLAQNGALNSVIERIQEIETTLDVLNSEKDDYELQLLFVESSKNHRAAAIQSVRDFIGEMAVLEGDFLFTVRVSLAECIRNLVEAVKLFPAGRLTSIVQINSIRTDLLSNGMPEDQVESYISEAYRTEPMRQNRSGRGRYVSRRDIGRHFLVQAKNGDYRVVYPDFDDPSIAVIDKVATTR